MHANASLPALPTAETPTPPSRSPFRFLNSALWIVFGVVLTLLVVLAVASSFFSGDSTNALVAALVAIVAVVVIRRMSQYPWTRLAVSYAGLAGVLSYLAADDPTLHRPLALAELAPSFPGAEKSYEVLMRYGKNHPLGRDFRFETPTNLYQGKGAFRPADSNWSAWLTANRADLESGWAKLEPVRAWWAELNTFERIADLTPGRIDAEIPTFQPIRTLTQHACAIASLQALDGNGDAAMETLLPILEVARKLQPFSRTLVRSMIARVSEKLAIETAAFVLDTASISAATRARLASALTGASGGEEGARRLLAMEYAWMTEVTNTSDYGVLMFPTEKYPTISKGLIALTPLVFNSRRTINLYGELTAELQDLAARRAVAEFSVRSREFFEQRGRVQFKNFGGTRLLTAMFPAYEKVVQSYWATEDLRSALQARLQT